MRIKTPKFKSDATESVKRFSDKEIRKLLKKKEVREFKDEELVSEIAKKLSWDHKQALTDIIIQENDRLEFFVSSKSKRIFQDISYERERHGSFHCNFIYFLYVV
jgi:hypothetical protein